ncbi:MAG: quinol dehydrogenase ferredoxin subunit NapH [Alphaproteobacteria bacterium]|nr:quinol dehydrogenase ferredoxin subunit NapH [Alphaproteobacteria bacterium]
MSGYYIAGRSAIAARGLWPANRWLILRRAVQLGVIGMFLAGPLAGVWIAKGNLASSLILDVIPLSDPFIQLQSLIAGHVAETDALMGAGLVIALYVLVGGRAFCAWVCPVNMVADAAHWARQSLGLKGGMRFSRQIRYWLLGMVLVVAFATGGLAWELVNPVTLTFRALVFGMGFAWAVVLVVFLLDLFVGGRVWCGHLCPMGAFYSLIGKLSILRIRASARDACDDCMDCYAACPEPQVISPALKEGRGPVVLSPNCTNCGRCADVCPQNVFEFSTRFINGTIENSFSRSEVDKEKIKEAAKEAA